jgi:hypothetical protein
VAKRKKIVRYVPDYEPVLPNGNSPGRTPSSVIIDVHYAKLLLVERWTFDRYKRLCKYLSMTPCEVASLALMPHSDVSVFEQTNQLHPQRARPIAMLLTLLEAHVAGKFFHDVIDNPFPDLNKLP